jgi:hypothetical protein
MAISALASIPLELGFYGFFELKKERRIALWFSSV